jgi:hypothetical protein
MSNMNLGAKLLPFCLNPTQSYALAAATLLRTVNIDKDSISNWVILDSSPMSNFLTTSAPISNVQRTIKPIIAQLPNGERV